MRVQELIPADDDREFSFERKGDADKKEDEDDEDDAVMDLDQLLDAWDDFAESGEGDKTEAGLAIRAAMKAFIAEEGLPVRAARSKSNLEVMNEIKKEMDIPVDEPEYDDEDDDMDDEPADPSKSFSKSHEDNEKDEEDEDEKQVARTPRSARGARPGRR